MTDIARHIRIFDKEPSDELVQKRTAAISSIAQQFGKLKTVQDILRLVDDLASGTESKGVLPDSRAIEIEAAIKQPHSPAFVREGNELQVLTCALLAALEVVSTAAGSAGHWTTADVLAVGLWSSFSFQGGRSDTRLENLRSELVDASRGLVMRTSLNSRLRQEVPDFSVKVADEINPAKLGDSIKSGAARTVDALRTNAALDREEIDLLWWVLSDWSNLLNRKLPSNNGVSDAIFAGIEAGLLMRRLPSESHKYLVLRRIKDDEQLTLKQLVEAIGDDARGISAQFSENLILKASNRVFPLLSALSDQNSGRHKTSRSLHLSDWASRALLESSILRVASLQKALL